MAGPTLSAVSGSRPIACPTSSMAGLAHRIETIIIEAIVAGTREIVDGCSFHCGIARCTVRRRSSTGPTAIMTPITHNRSRTEIPSNAHTLVR